MATIKVSVKAFEGLEQENAYISATRPSTKILSTFFTIQLLILGAVTPKMSNEMFLAFKGFHAHLHRGHK